MRFRLNIVLPIAILLLAVAVRAADPGPVEAVRMAVFDTYQLVKPRPYEDVPVRVVSIDDESLARLGQWPWPRSFVATLLQRLDALGAAAIGFDIVFAEPDRTSPRQVLPLWTGAADDPVLAQLAERLPDHDAQFAAAVAAAPVVLGFPLVDRQTERRPRPKWGIATAGDEPTRFLTRFKGAIANLPALDDAASGTGAFNVELDPDGRVRRLPLLFAASGGADGRTDIYPSLAAEALRVGQQASTYLVKSSGASGESALGISTGVNHVKIGDFEVPTDGAARVWLYDTGPVAVRSVPAWAVLEPDFDRELVTGGIVLIGAGAAGLLDLRATPLDPAAPGVTVNAQIIEQIILGRFLERPDWMIGAELVFLLIFGGAVLYILPRRGAVWCAALAVLSIVAAVGISWVAFVRMGWLADPLYPSLAVLVLYLAQSLLVYLRTEGERRHVRQAFGRYLSPAVVERLARDPSHLRLGGEIRDMTVLFCDVRDFTRLSEKLDAHAVTRFLNRFLTPMTDAILARRGTIDKYMGDAIMAFWNAPLDNPDHVADGARAALDMIAQLGRLNTAGGAGADGAFGTIAIGIGLNSGPCCVGNLGSEQRFDYSAVGDNVNLASRLESQSKTYGVQILIGEATQARLPGFAAIELDRLKVKGRAQAVTIYALLGDETTGRENWFTKLLHAHTGMLQAYRACDWDQAETLLATARVAAGGRLDRVHTIYAERIAAWRRNPPPPTWDAVVEAAEK